jgi:hypothetical protein
MADLRRAHYAVGRRCVRFGGFFLAGVAVLSRAVLDALSGVGATPGSTLSFANAVTTQLDPLEVARRQAIPGIAVTPCISGNVPGSVGATGHSPSDAFAQRFGAGVRVLPDFAACVVDDGTGSTWNGST